MPHARCSICRSPNSAAVDAALKAGDSIRVVAGRFGLSRAAVDRHHHEGDRAESRTNAGDLKHIDEEIKKLMRAQNRAKKKRDADQVLAIFRELRNWFVIRQKAEFVSIATTEFKEKGQDISAREALGLAQSIIEAAL
jgi:hypothetical protein